MRGSRITSKRALKCFGVCFTQGCRVLPAGSLTKRPASLLCRSMRARMSFFPFLLLASMNCWDFS